MDKALLFDWGSKYTKVAFWDSSLNLIYGQDHNFFEGTIRVEENKDFIEDIKNLRARNEIKSGSLKKAFFSIQKLLLNENDPVKKDEIKKAIQFIEKEAVSFFSEINKRVIEKFGPQKSNIRCLFSYPSHFDDERILDSLRVVLEQANFKNIEFHDESKCALKGIFELSFSSSISDLSELKKNFKKELNSSKPSFAVYDIGHFTTDFGIAHIIDKNTIEIKNPFSQPFAGYFISTRLEKNLNLTSINFEKKERVKLYFSEVIRNSLQGPPDQRLPNSPILEGKEYFLLNELSSTFQEDTPLKKGLNTIIRMGLPEETFESIFTGVQTIFLTGGGALWPDIPKELRNRFPEKTILSIPENNRLNFLIILLGLLSTARNESIAVEANLSHDIELTLKCESEVLGHRKLGKKGQELKEFQSFPLNNPSTKFFTRNKVVSYEIKTGTSIRHGEFKTDSTTWFSSLGSNEKKNIETYVKYDLDNDELIIRFKPQGKSKRVHEKKVKLYVDIKKAS